MTQASGREWITTLNVQCASCEAKATATVSDLAAFNCVEGVKRVLRYQGWRIDRRDNLCPSCAGPIPKCPICGDLTPEPYASKGGEHYNGGHRWTCSPCQRKALRAAVAQYDRERHSAGVRR